MDDIVKAALKKWPNVPHCYDWLALDARGDWYLRDAAVQAAGPFPQSKGQRVVHDKLKAFIARNYLADAHGAWHFQNGPQRVYVQLESAPWVWRVRWPDEAGAAAPAPADRPEVDRWLLAKVQALVETVTAALENYDPTGAAQASAGQK